MFEREKLSGNNFNDWFRQLKLVLRVEKKMFVIEQPIPPAPAADSAANVLAEWNAIYDAYNEVACLMLGSMTPELHKQFENYSPYEMLQELKSMFEKQAGVERFDLIQTFHACKQEEGKSVGAYVLQMKGYVDQQERLAKGKGKANGKGNDKQVYTPKPKNPKPSTKEHPAKDETCHHYKEVGHWKRNSPIYLAELLKKKKQVGSASSSSIFTIELFAFYNKSWVYDIGCGTHICITKQGFREARKLKQGALYLTHPDLELYLTYKMSGEEPAPQMAPVKSPQMISTVKLPMLKKGEYTLWSMRMEQYLTNIDYGLWQVIMNGDEPVQTIKDENGVETEVPPKTAQALLQRQKEIKDDWGATS
ncbi:hypothetical protein Tco_0745088 [Tanacetum coccineum]